MRVLIVGGGAAGLMAALKASENEKNEVFLFEKNLKLGAKILISGGGRANVCTGFEDKKEILECYPRGKKLIKYLLHEFSPMDLREFFEDGGVKLKVEKDMRVFPVSDKSSDVVEFFERRLREQGVKIHLGRAVKKIEKIGEEFVVEFEDVKSKKSDSQKFSKVILTTGGQAYRQTGSTGDGYAFAESFGHSISKLSPSLNSLILEEKEWTKLSGVPFKNVCVKVLGEKICGDFIFTHKGISGPLAFKISSSFAHEEISKNESLEMSFDFVVDKNFEDLKSEVLKFSGSKKSIKNVLNSFLTKSFTAQLLEFLGIDGDKILAEISKKDLNKIVQNLKDLKLHGIGRSSGEEFVTAGGVSIDEIDVKNMESKKVPGLHFAGEILDVDGFTGGFNLYAAFGGGYLAGRNG